MTHKACKDCGKLLPLSEFYKRCDRDCYYTRCKVCYNDRIKRKRDNDDWRADKCQWAKSNRPQSRDREKRHAAAYRERYPEKARAKQLLNLAVKRGDIVRPERCERCGESPPPRVDGVTGIHGHHHDYSKPFEVEWLCAMCHSKEHREQDAEEKRAA